MWFYIKNIQHSLFSGYRNPLFIYDLSLSTKQTEFMGCDMKEHVSHYSWRVSGIFFLFGKFDKL